MVLLPLLLLLLLDDAAAAYAVAAATLLRFCVRRASGGVVLQSRCLCDVAVILRPSCIAFIPVSYTHLTLPTKA